MTNKRALGIISALLLLMGVFAPLLDVFGTNYYNNGEGDGSIVLVLVVIMLLLSPFTDRKLARWGLWPVVVLIASIVAIDFIDTIDRIGFDNMNWGWIPLIVGSILALVAAGWPVYPAGQRK